MTDETVRRLQALDEEYTAAVNTAIAERPHGPRPAAWLTSTPTPPAEVMDAA